MTAIKRANLEKADYEALAEFRYAIRLFLHFSEEAAQAVGLTPQQHQALLSIQGFPKRDFVTIGELAERLQIRHHSTVGLVDRLVAQRLVTRRQADQDRRQVYVTLTPEDVALLEQLSLAHQQELHRIHPQLAQLLGRLNDTPDR